MTKKIRRVADYSDTPQLMNQEMESKNAVLKHFMPAMLHRTKSDGWYIDYYAFHLVEQQMKRKRICLNMAHRRCKTHREFLLYANQVVDDINRRLRTGWSPWNSNDNYMLANVLMKEVIEHYLDVVQRQVRPDTFRSYASFGRMFGQWMVKRYPDCPASYVTQSMALEYLEIKQIEHHWGPRTYNNNLKQGRALFSWSLKHGYCTINPFAGINTMRVLKKKRSIIPAHVIAMIDAYFRIENPTMCIIMRMVYTSLLRPVEISRVQVKQIDFTCHCIHMPGERTKNGEARDARMDDELEKLLKRYIQNADEEDYLFSKHWRCGKEPKRSHEYSKVWSNMRMNLLDEKGKRIVRDDWQLYSLRDTSINGMVKSGIDSLSVMQAAGHKDLSMTLIYANHVDENLFKKLNKQAPGFGKEDQ